jgi:hypothetical protein
MYADDSCRVTVLLGCPANVLGDIAPASLADPSHSLRSLFLPPAALPSLPVKIGNANTRNLHRNVEVFLYLKHTTGIILDNKGLLP